MLTSTKYLINSEHVDGAVNEPANPIATFVMAHGAGTAFNHPWLEQAATAFAAEGIRVVRFNFPYMQAGRKAPPRGDVNIDAFGELLPQIPGSEPVFLGGKSYGGRMATMAVARGTGAAGCILLGYPLHPPGKPEKARTGHLPEVGVPMLFLSGTRDPFCTHELAREHLHELVWVEGGDHSLKQRSTPVESTLKNIAGLTRKFIERTIR